MNIVHLATSHKGGAGLAASLTHKELMKRGIPSILLSRPLKGYAPGINEIDIGTKFHEKAVSKTLTMLQSNLIQRGRDLATPYSINFTNQIEKYFNKSSIVHIHSSYNLIAIEDIDWINNVKGCIVSLHDQRFLTGACHLTKSCERYITEACAKCPEVNFTFKNRVQKNHVKMSKTFSNPKIKFVAPSNWIMNKALLRYKNIDISQVYNVPQVPKIRLKRDLIRRKLKFNENEVYVGFVATKISDSYKGFSIYLDAVNKIQSNKTSSKIRFHALGEYDKSLMTKSQIRFHSYESNREKLLEFIEALDILVISSTADHIPNLILEAAFVGTIVIASEINGIPEIQNALRMPLFQSGNSYELQNKILETSNIVNSVYRSKLENMARAKFDPDTELIKLIKMYSKF